MYDSTAILERATVRNTFSTKIGRLNGCFYCAARDHFPDEPGAVVAKLNGYDCGQRFIVCDDQKTARPFSSERKPTHLRRYPASDDELFGSLPLIPRPWMPPLSLRDAFVVDELANWFINRGLSTNSFHWKGEDCVEIARSLWEKRIPIYPSDLSAVFCAHGLPSQHQQELEKLFEISTKTLLSQKPKKLIQKKRLSGFADTFLQPSEWSELYILPFIERMER